MEKKSFLSAIPKSALLRAKECIEAAIKEQEHDAQEMHSVHKPESGKKSVHNFKKEVVQDSISLEDLITWAKANVPNVPNVVLTILKKKSTVKGYNIDLMLAFAKDNQPLLGEDYPSAIIHCKRINDDLYNTFGDQDIIVIE